MLIYNCCAQFILQCADIINIRQLLGVMDEITVIDNNEWDNSEWKQFDNNLAPSVNILMNSAADLNYANEDARDVLNVIPTFVPETPR